MCNVNNPSDNDSNEQAKDEQMVQTGHGINTGHVILQGPETLQELNKQLHQTQINKLEELFKRVLKWR